MASELHGSMCQSLLGAGTCDCGLSAAWAPVETRAYHGEAAFMPDAMAAAREAELVQRMAEDEVTQGVVDGAQIVRDLRRARGMAEDTSIPDPMLALMAERDAAVARADAVELTRDLSLVLIMKLERDLLETKEAGLNAATVAHEWRDRALALEQRLAERDASVFTATGKHR